MSTVTTSHFAIMDYWRDKALCKDGTVITEEEAKKIGFVDTIPVVKDWGEPMCWACSQPIIGNYEKKCEHNPYTREDEKLLWSDKKVKSKLNRCHILPAALGGEDSPGNLFLMCESCHFLSPDSRNKEGFFRWVYRQRKKTDMGKTSFTEIMKLVDEELNDRGLPNYLEIFKQCPNMKMDNGGEYLASRVNTHGVTLVTSSVIVAIADWLEMGYRQAMIEKMDLLSRP